MNLGAGELVLLIVIVLLVFAPSRLPALGDAIGKAVQNFKRGSRDPERASREAIDVTPKKD